MNAAEVDRVREGDDVVLLRDLTDDDGPPKGQRLRVLLNDQSCIPFKLGFWVTAEDVAPAERHEGQANHVLALLRDGWSLAAGESSYDSSAVLVWRHEDCDLAVEIGGGTVDFVGSTRSPDQFTPAELRAFAALAEETER